MDVRVFESRAVAERAVAAEVAALIQADPETVLGLASGDTPTGVYRELVRLHHVGLDLSRVRTFNLDEYLGVDPDDPRSFHAFMRRHLFDPAGIPSAHVRFPGGLDSGRTTPVDERAHQCADFEREIREAGGVALQLLGIGRNGHIGFNEPGSIRTSRTRLVELESATRADAAPTFGRLDLVPTHALTMGVATILDAHRVRVMAFGSGKRALVKRTLDERSNPAWPASFVHEHPDAQLIVDREAMPT